MRNLLVCLLIMLIYESVSAQKSKHDGWRIKDDPAARLEFEFLKTRNPVTGKVPLNIREKELGFAEMTQSGSAIPLAAGDISTAWINRGPNNVGGRTRALAIDVDTENTILAGGVSGGMWKSTDQGASWSKTTGSTELQSVSCIAQDLNSTNNDTWYYGTGEFSGNTAGSQGAFYLGDGIYKSIDNGDTWTLLPATASASPQSTNDFDVNHEIVVNPTNGDVLVANLGGIYYSNDGGMTFSQELDNGFGWSDVVMSPGGVAYAVLETGGIFSSTDGTTWSDIGTNGPTFFTEDRVELAIANENSLYLLGEENNTNENGDHKLWHFNDATDTWTDLSANVPQLGGQTGTLNSQGGYDLLIKVQPGNDNLVVIGGRNLWRSTDGFTTTSNTSWIGGYTPQNNSFNLYSNHHPDQHAFLFLSSNTAISGTDGGLHFTVDITAESTTTPSEEVTWTSLNNGYLTTQVYALSAGPGDRVFAGFQDNGTWGTISGNEKSDWTEIFSGDGGYSAWTDDGTTRIVSVQKGQIFRLSFDNADDLVPSNPSGIEITPTGYSSSLFIVPFYLDPGDDNVLFLGGDKDLFVNSQVATATSNNGWKSIALGATGEISEIGLSEFGVAYIGTSDGEVYRVDDAISSSPSVTEVTGSGFPNGYISGVAVNPFRPNEALVCFSNYEVISIFHTDNSGSTWTDVSGNLEENLDGSGDGPSIRSVRILGDGDRFFAGTSTGVYSTDVLNGTGTMWVQENSPGLGNVVVEHMIVRENDGTALVVAGTHGNGVYSATFESSPGLDNDLGITQIKSPTSGLLTATEAVTATILNFGVLDQMDFTVSLFLDNQLVVTDDITGPLAGKSAMDHTFSVPVNVAAPGEYDIRAVVTLSGDENSFNDDRTETVKSFRVITTFPYTESFETPDHDWEEEIPWELGTPVNVILSAASDGTQAWVTNLDGDYPNNADSELRSPVFDFTNLVEPAISFDISYSLENTFDGVVLGYRTDLTSEFTTVPSSAGGSNWYTINVDAFDNTPAWTGNSGGYVNAKAELKDLAGMAVVQLALIFKSDVNFSFEGMAFDNVLISDDYIPNIVPSFTSGPDISVEANSGPQNIAGWATNISDGNNETQVLSFEVTNDNNGLFSQPPALTLSGDLSFTSAQNSVGTANVTVVLSDDGGTPSDLTDNLSTTDSFVIDITAIVGIEDELAASVNVYPNPTTGSLGLDFKGVLQPLTLEIHNMGGIRLGEVRQISGSGYLQLDLSKYTNGTYFLILRNAGMSEVVRILKTE